MKQVLKVGLMTVRVSRGASQTEQLPAEVEIALHASATGGPPIIDRVNIVGCLYA